MNPLRSATEMVKGIRVSSVLGSILFIIPFVLAALVAVSFSDNTIVQVFLMRLSGILVGLFIVCYLGILLLCDHKELQSEDHTFNMRALEIFGDQKHIREDFKDSPIENNPEMSDPKSTPIPSLKNFELIQNDNE